jgi:hypothetical protein
MISFVPSHFELLDLPLACVLPLASTFHLLFSACKLNTKVNWVPIYPFQIITDLISRYLTAVNNA